MRSIMNKFQKQDVFFLLGSLLLVAFYVATSGGGFPLDDSWIHQTYARNLALRGEWAFVPGEPSAASTSPLYTVVLAIGYKLSVPYDLWAHLIGALSLSITAMLGSRMARILVPKQPYADIFVGVTLILIWHLIWAAASGMETMLFSMLTLALLYTVWRGAIDDSDSIQVVARYGLLFGVLSALTTLARPEGVMLAGLIGLVLLIAYLPGHRSKMVVWTVGAGISFILVISPYLILNLQLTGGLLPNTASAKFAQHAILLQLPYWDRILSMVIPIFAGGQLLLVPGIMYYFLMVARHQERRTRLLYLIPALWAVGLILLYAARLPASYQHGRYVIPALPALVFMGAVGTMGLVQWGRFMPIKRVVSRSLFVSASLAMLVLALGLAPSIYRTDVNIINEEMVVSAHWIAENIAADELLAVHDIGAVGYFASRPILDIAGLVSPDTASIVADADALWQTMRDQNAQYLMAFPDQIPGDRVDDPRLCTVFNTKGQTSRLVGGPNMAIYRLNWTGECAS